jgi:hypothetical protein
MDALGTIHRKMAQGLIQQLVTLTDLQTLFHEISQNMGILPLS